MIKCNNVACEMHITINEQLYIASDLAKSYIEINQMAALAIFKQLKQ